MSFLEKMQSRYTTKMYNGDKISDAIIEELKEILRLSPSSINSQPWEFVWIRDAEKKAPFAEVAKHNKDKIMKADSLIIFRRLDNVEAFEQQMKVSVPEGAHKYYDAFIKPLGDQEIKHWMGRQLYLAMGVFFAACAQMEIDSTPMEGIQEEEFDKILGADNYKNSSGSYNWSA